MLIAVRDKIQKGKPFFEVGDQIPPRLLGEPHDVQGRVCGYDSSAGALVRHLAVFLLYLAHVEKGEGGPRPPHLVLQKQMGSRCGTHPAS